MQGHTYFNYQSKQFLNLVALWLGRVDSDKQDSKFGFNLEGFASKFDLGASNAAANSLDLKSPAGRETIFG